MEQHADPVTLGLLSRSIVFHTDQLRSLDVLRAIQTAVNVLRMERPALQAYCETVDSAIADLKRHGSQQFTDYVDPKGSASDKLLEAQHGARKLHDALENALLLCKQNVPDQEDVIGELTETVPIVAALHDGLNTLRWRMAQHDAGVAGRADKSEKTYSSPQEIETFLRSI